MKHDVFDIAEMVSNSTNGKTSAAKTVGTYLCLFGSLSFGYACAFISQTNGRSDVLIQSLAIITIGAGLIAGKIIKPTEDKITNNNTTD